MVRKFKEIKISKSPQFRNRKPVPVLSRDNHRKRNVVLFILKLAAVLFVIFAIARHRIWRLK